MSFFNMFDLVFLVHLPVLVEAGPDSDYITGPNLSENILSFQVLFRFFLSTPKGAQMKEIIFDSTRFDGNAMRCISDPG